MDGANDAHRARGGGRAGAGREGHRAAVGAADRPRRLPHADRRSTPRSSSSRRPTRTRSSCSRCRKTSLLGKPIYGVEVSHNVAQNAASRRSCSPASHHAREWPTAEFTLEFVWDLLLHDGTDPDATNLLEKGKLIAVPVVNPDGYDISRSLRTSRSARTAASRTSTRRTSRRSPSAGGRERQPRRRQQPQLPPVLGRPGLEHERDRVQHARAEAPASEPENQGMIDLLRTRNQITVAINNHTPDQRLLRAPSSSNEPQIVADHAAYEALLRAAGDATSRAGRRPVDRRLLRGVAAPPSSRPTTRYGAFGFTPEATPGFSGAQTFHPPYQNVIDNYLGIGTRYAGADDARALLRRVQGRDRAAAALGDHRHGARGRDADADARRTRWTRRSRRGRPASRRRSARSRNAIRTTHHRAGERHASSGTSTRRCAPSQYSSRVPRRVLRCSTCTAADGTVLETTTVKIARGQARQPRRCARRAASAARCRRRSSLTLGTPATFGAFTPGVAREYDASTTANVISTAGNAALVGRRPGHRRHRPARQRRVRARPAAARGRDEPGRRHRRRARGGRRLREPHDLC